MATKGCSNCKHREDIYCVRKRKQVGVTINPYTGNSYPKYDTSWIDLPTIRDERNHINGKLSFIFGKHCGPEGIYHESF